MAKGKKTGGRNFEKGKSGNPNGRPRLSPEAKAIKKLTSDEYITLVGQFLNTDKKKLEDYLKLQTTTVLEHMVGQIILNAIKTGGHVGLEALLQRVIGKVPDTVELTGWPELRIKKRDGSEVIMGMSKKGEKNA